VRLGAIVASLALLVACATTRDDTRPIPAAWLSVPAAPQHREPSYGPVAPRASALHVVKTSEGMALANGDKVLTPYYLAIDSFDIAPEGDLAVFSAKRRDNFDIGLVATAGSQVNWVPSDLHDEVAVQWAPRGNKVSYVIRAASGDVIRSVHVHTAAQVASTFPNGRVRSYAWEPRADHYAVAWSAIDASDGIEEMTYAGAERKWLTPPAVRIDVAMEPIGGATVMRPQSLHYNERLPLVVWRTSDPFEWDDARGRLQASARVAVAVLDHDPDEKFWRAIGAIPWVDGNRVWVVGTVVGEGGPAHATSIVAGHDLSPGRYRVRDNIVVAPPDVIKSFAAGSIADQLKGNPATNGSSR
jgi:hypothetical protein